MPNKTEIRCFKRWILIKDKKEGEEISDDEKPTDAEIGNQIALGSQWTDEEDQLLVEKVQEFGTTNWVIIARFLNGRLGRQCRERWHNVLNPNIVRRDWTPEEDAFIIKMYKEHGSKWAQFSKMKPLEGRTVSQIKNRFYQSLKGKDFKWAKDITDGDQHNPKPKCVNKRIEKAEQKGIKTSKTSFDEAEPCSKMLKPPSVVSSSVKSTKYQSSQRQLS